MNTLSNLFKTVSLLDEIKQERILYTVSQVGLYHNNYKILEYDNCEVRLSNFRILVISKDTIEITLDRIKNVSTQSGVLRSSPKIILTLGILKQEVEWVCSICQTKNTRLKCTNCGVKSDQGLTCPKCTFVNHNDMIYCEMCESLLGTDSSEEYIVKLSFRNGGHTEMLMFLEQALKDKQWIEKITIKVKGHGVGAVLSTLEQKQVETRQTIQFQDLDQLMKKAHEVTRLVQSILSRVNSPSQDHEFQKQLWELGLVQPMTLGSKSDYHSQLSNEILGFLKSYSTVKQVKVIALSDLYCLFNRARGVLVSPQDIYKASMLLQDSDEFCARTFTSGVVVLEHKEFRQESLKSVLEWLKVVEKCTAMEMAKQYTCSVLVAKELLLSFEQKGYLCRDDTFHGLVFYPNLFLDPHLP